MIGPWVFISLLSGLHSVFLSLWFFCFLHSQPHCKVWLSPILTVSNKISLVRRELSAFSEQGRWNKGVVCLVKAIVEEKRAAMFMSWETMPADACSFETLVFSYLLFVNSLEIRKWMHSHFQFHCLNEKRKKRPL